MSNESSVSPSVTIIWPWRDAPPQLRELSQHGGDEDWVVMLPADHHHRPWYFDINDGDDYFEEWGHAQWCDYAEWRIVIFAHA